MIWIIFLEAFFGSRWGIKAEVEISYEAIAERNQNDPWVFGLSTVELFTKLENIDIGQGRNSRTLF